MRKVKVPKILVILNFIATREWLVLTLYCINNSKGLRLVFCIRRCGYYFWDIADSKSFSTYVRRRNKPIFR